MYVCIVKSVLMRNLQHIIFYVKTKILTDSYLHQFTLKKVDRKIRQFFEMRYFGITSEHLGVLFNESGLIIKNVFIQKINQKRMSNTLDGAFCENLHFRCWIGFRIRQCQRSFLTVVGDHC